MNIIFDVKLDGVTIMYIWKIENCINFTEVDGIKYSNIYHLMYYFHMTKYLNKLKDNFQNWKMTDTMLYHLNNNFGKLEPSIRCIGNRNPGVENLKEIFFKNKKNDLFKYHPSEKKSE